MTSRCERGDRQYLVDSTCTRYEPARDDLVKLERFFSFLESMLDRLLFFKDASSAGEYGAGSTTRTGSATIPVRTAVPPAMPRPPAARLLPPMAASVADVAAAPDNPEMAAPVDAVAMPATVR